MDSKDTAAVKFTLGNIPMPNIKVINFSSLNTVEKGTKKNNHENNDD